MNYTEHALAGAFLAAVRPALELHESVHALMLGVAERLVDQPYAYGSTPYMATLESAGRVLAAALMTPPRNLLLYAADDRDVAGLDLVAEALQRGEWPVPGVIAPQAVAEAFASAWSRRTGARSRTVMRMGVYELRRVVPPAYPAGEMRQATAQDLELAQDWARAFAAACFPDDRGEQAAADAERKVSSGTLFFWVDGRPVSMAARSRPTAHGEAVGFVYTPPEHRRRGYATALVARVSQRVLDDGKQFCTLHTDMSNPTSNQIYRSIGYTKLAEVLEVAFEGTKR